MSKSPAGTAPTAILTSPSPSPRRGSFNTVPLSPRPSRMTSSSRLPSISASQTLELGPDYGIRTNLVLGFSPPTAATSLPPLPETVEPPITQHSFLALNTSAYPGARLSPQLGTPTEQISSYSYLPEGSPRPTASSPRSLIYGELPPRSRRNSAAVVSISLSSRSRSRTPRGSTVHLPGIGSGPHTPSKGSTTVTPRGDDHLKNEVMVQMGSVWARGTEDTDDWQPTGGVLLDADDEEVIAEDDGDHQETHDGRTWTEGTEVFKAIRADVLSPGMLFGEGLEFRGEVIEPAVGRVGRGGDADQANLPLRRGGSEAGQALRGGLATQQRDRRVYEVIRQLGTGSYAVVYLVRERGGRKREFALKCLSKQDLEDEQIDTQLFEATIHLSLPIHNNIVTLHQTLQTRKWLFLMLEPCPGEDLFFWLEKSRDVSPRLEHAILPGERSHPMSSSKFSSSSIPFSSSQLFGGMSSHLSSSLSASPYAFSHLNSSSPASILFTHHNGNHFTSSHAHTPPTPSLLSSFSANTLLSPRRLRLIASMFSQMCEAVAVCHDFGISHRDIKPENFICCDSIELESAADEELDFGPQAKRKVVVKLTDFGLATTEEESGDVECGSKPYMAFECRNNLGPTYCPASADVWSLGIVLINMLFHRNPWKDPVEGDENFDNFLGHPLGFLMSKFNGIGREVANYLANHVICLDVAPRVGAREFGNWVKNLPDMIAGRQAVRQLKMAKLDTKLQPADKTLFVKSPVESKSERLKKGSTSALTSTAPALSSLPRPAQLSDYPPQLPTPDLDGDYLYTPTTADDQQTPADSDFPSPDAASPTFDITDLESVARDDDDDDSKSLSTHKRRKRGVRKGKAAQAAIAAAHANEKPSQGERDALLAELAKASQSLARDLSKNAHQPDLDAEDFPPLGTTPAQAAAEKRSKWKDLLRFSDANPELQALALRVAERDAGSSGNWSAPAKLQADRNKPTSPPPPFKQTSTMSTGVSSALSSFGPISVSSATSSSGGIDEEDWRKPKDEARARERTLMPQRNDEDAARARKAALAAAAMTGSMGPMGSFGKSPNGPTQHGPLFGRNVAAQAVNSPAAPSTYLTRPSPLISSQRAPARSGLSHSSGPLSLQSIASDERLKPLGKPINQPAHKRPSPLSSAGTPSYDTSRSTLIASESSSTITSSAPLEHGPNKPKLKGQIQSLAKMLSGLKTKGKD